MSISPPCETAFGCLVTTSAIMQMLPLAIHSRGIHPPGVSWKPTTRALAMCSPSCSWQIEGRQTSSELRPTTAGQLRCSAADVENQDLADKQPNSQLSSSPRFPDLSFFDSGASKEDGELFGSDTDGRLQSTRQPSKRKVVEFATQKTPATGSIRNFQNAGEASPRKDGFVRGERRRKDTAETGASVSCLRDKEITGEEVASQENGSIGNHERETSQDWRLRKPQMSFAREDMTNGVRIESFEDSASNSGIEWYVPRVGDTVIGVIVSGNEFEFDVDIGSEKLGCTLSKDASPLDSFRPDELLWELREDDDVIAGNLDVAMSQIRFVSDGDALHSTSSVLVGSVLPLQVSALTMSGKPLLSVRKYARRMAWHRVRQIHELNEPFRVQCVAWNSDGLIFKVEGLRAVLPREQCVNKPIESKSFRMHVGEWKTVLITDVDESSGQLLLSEKRAWTRIGSLVVGTVERMFPFGVEVALIGTTLRAMIHISHISQDPVLDVSSVFSVGEKVKAVIIKPVIAQRIALSTAHLESSSGLILQDKARVFQEAEEMAARYRSSLPDDENQESKYICDSPDPVFANQAWLDEGDWRF